MSGTVGILDENQHAFTKDNPLPVSNIGLPIPYHTSYSVDLSNPSSIVITYLVGATTVATETITITPTIITDEVTV